MSIPFEIKQRFLLPQEKVYKALLDLDVAKHWMQSLVQIKRLDDGPMKVGSGWRETRKMNGKEAMEYFKVVELARPNKIVLLAVRTKGSTGKGQYL